MNKTTLITLMLVAGTCLQNAVAKEALVETINPETGEVMLIPDTGMCPTAPSCPPPIQELETEEDEADNG